MKLAIIILAAVAAFAQMQPAQPGPTKVAINGNADQSGTTPTAPAVEAAKPAPPPAIDPTAVAVFWKAQAELLNAKLTLLEKDAASAAAASKLTCPAGFQVAPSQALIGMECVPKPTPPAPAPPKEEVKK